MRRGHAENLVAERYDALVNVAFHATAVRLGRHRRVLIAHEQVQRLPRQLAKRSESVSTPQLFALVLAEAFSAQDLRRGVGITGLRFFPVTDALEPLQLEESLHRVDPAGRAAWALHHRGGFDELTIGRILADAGVASPQDAVAAMAQVSVPAEQIFDPCSVRLAPEWRRRRPSVLLAAAMVLILLAVGASVWAATGTANKGQASTTTTSAARSGDEPASGRAGELAAALADQWRHTSKLDFGAWAPRGELVADRQLQDRMWQFWQRGQSVTAAVGTSAVLPAQRPAPLYAGKVDGSLVIVAYDGSRVVRYMDTGKKESLRIDRVDSADLMTSAAVVVSRTAVGARYLLAPWIAGVAVRDLTGVEHASKPLATLGGLTAALPSGGSGCSSRYALELRSSSAVAEKHAFLLADLGDLVPAHLTYMAAPSHGAARSPREVLSQDARSSWALHACELDAWRDSGVRIVNNWTFAEQVLPGAGSARWACLRVDGWSGSGRATVSLEPPSGPALPVTSMSGTSDCSRFSQNVVAATLWRSPAQGDFLLVAGSRNVSTLLLSTNRGMQTASPPLAQQLAPGTRITGVQAKLTNGKLLNGQLSATLLAPSGGR